MIENTVLRNGVVYLAFRSENFREIEVLLQQHNLSLADFHYCMEQSIQGIIDGLLSIQTTNIQQ